MSDHSDIDRISDLCLNYKSRQQRLDDIADKIRLLTLEVDLLNKRLDEAEKYKRAIESL